MKIERIALGVLVLTMLGACNQAEVDRLTTENEELKSVSAQKDSSINSMLSSFNEIQNNLKEIKRSEGLIDVNILSEGNKKDIESSIMEDVELISELMKRNEELINNLNKELENSNFKMDEFRKLIIGLNEQVQQKNIEIAGLNKQLQLKKIKIGQLYYALDSLNFIYEVAEAEIEQKIEQINTAYYAYGTFKELKEKKVLEKEGGVLGLGQTKDLKDNFNREYFSKIDITKQKSFLIYAKKAKLVTNHPTGSYEFRGEDGKVDSLVITNVEDFWRATKYLVIVVD